MTQVTLQKEKPHAIRRLTGNSKIYKSIIRAIQDKKAENIVALDLRKIPEAVADFFVICEGGSGTQVKAIADFIAERVKEETGETPYRVEGMTALQWVLIDYVNIVAHIFMPENRKFYQLEEMWNDAGKINHEG